MLTIRLPRAPPAVHGARHIVAAGSLAPPPTFRAEAAQGTRELRAVRARYTQSATQEACEA